LSQYTTKKKSHNVFFEKTSVFSHLLQLRFGYSTLHIVYCHGQAAIEESKAGDGHSLFERRYGDRTEQNPAQAWMRVLDCCSIGSAHRGKRHPCRGSAHSCTYLRRDVQHGVARCMRGMIMGRATVASSPPASTVRWSTTKKLMPGPNGGITAIVNQRRRPGTRDRTRRLIQTPAHKAEAFVCHLTTPRERARHLQPSIISRGSWNAWSVNRWQLLPLRRRLRHSSMRFSAWVSFSLFIEILNCLKFARFLVFFSIERRVLSLSLHLWKVFGQLPVRWRPVPYGFRLRPEVRLVVPLCVFLNII
jgi:hypothetical protein